MPELIDRKSAHAAGRKTYFTGQPCRHGHTAERYTSTGGCTGCLGQFRKIQANAHTRTLIPYTLPPGYFVPDDMQPAHYEGLEEFLHTCVAHWVTTQKMMTPERQNSYEKYTRHRAQKRKV